MSDIFREVDEALQEDKVKQFWKEYGPVLITAAVLLILSTAATTGYRAWDQSRDQSETAKVLNALQSSEPVPALQAAAQDTRAGHEAVAKLISASMSAQEGGIEGAAKMYKEVYENKKTPAPLDALARILFVRASLSSEQNSGKENLIAVLTPVIEDENSPYAWQARIDGALIKGGLQNDYDGALAYLAPFEAQENVPQSLKDKAASLSQLYAQKSKTASETPSSTQ